MKYCGSDGTAVMLGLDPSAPWGVGVRISPPTPNLMSVCNSTGRD